MRLIDADAAILDARANYGWVHDAVLMERFLNFQPTIAVPPNGPLTLEQLREMDGEPVWTVALDYGASRWAFVSADCEVVRYFTTRRGVTCDVIGRHFRTYGDTWLAYRRKPEEGTM